MRKTKKTLAILALVAMVLTMIPIQVFAASDDTRISGADRIATAIAVADAGWTSADTVILAAADQANLVDALAAASLAGQEDAPILLTFKAALNADVAAKIKALGASKVYVVGAAQGLADAVDAIDGVTVEKLAGDSRWATADAINAKLSSPAGTFVVGYNAVADALSAASYAAANNYAIVLTKADGSVDASKLVGDKTYLVGGTSVVKDYEGATRLGGTDRFATNTAVVEGLTYSVDKVYVANGISLVDALVAAPLAAKAKAAVLLASATDVAAKGALTLTSSSKVIALGGETAVSDAVKGKVAYVAPAVLAVESVSANNLIQAVVKFSQPVDEDSAETTTNYSVSGLTVSAAELGKDEQTVTLKFAAAMTNFKEYTLVVEDVKDANGTKIADTTVKYTVSDTAIPTVSAVAKGNKVIEISFSEPVQNANDFDAASDLLTNITLDDAGIDVDDATGGGDAAVDAVASINTMGTKLTLTFTNPIALGEHDLKIAVDGSNDIADYAGYKVAPQVLKVNVATENVIPNVTSVQVNGQTEVVVNFSKGMAISTSGDKAKFYWNTTGSASDNTKTADTISKVSDTSWKIKYTATGKPMPAGTVYFFVKDVVDYSDNKIVGNTTTANVYKSTLTVTADVAPVVKSVTSSKDTEIVVKFNNSMNTTEAQKKSNYVLKDSDGDVVTLPTPVYTDADKEVKFTFGSALTGGTYKLTVKAIKDVVDVKTTEATFDVAISDSTAPTISSIEYKGDAMIVTFNEKMATSGTYSLANASAYQYDGKDLPAGTTVEVLSGDKRVKLTLPTGSWDGTKVLKVGYFKETTIKTVSDASGNLFIPVSGAIVAGLSGTNITDNIDIQDAGVTVKVVSSTKVEVVTVSGDPAWASVVAGDFTVGGANAIAASIDADNARKIYLEVSDDDKFNAGSTPVVATKNQTMSSKDVFGAKITQNRTSVAGTNSIKPTLKAAAVQADGTLLVAFDANIDTATLTKYDFIVEFDDKSLTGDDLTVASQQTDSKNIVISLASGSIPVGKTVVLKTVGTDFIDVKGKNGALIAANTDGITASDMAAVAITLNNKAAGVADTIEIGDYIDVKFNRALDFESISADWDSGLAAVTATVAADGTMVFEDGVNIGKISGLVVATGSDITVDLTKADNYTLRITVAGVGTADLDALAGSLIYFESSDALKSSSGIAIDDAIKPVTDTNI